MENPLPRFAPDALPFDKGRNLPQKMHAFFGEPHGTYALSAVVIPSVVEGSPVLYGIPPLHSLLAVSVGMTSLRLGAHVGKARYRYNNSLRRMFVIPSAAEVSPVL